MPNVINNLAQRCPRKGEGQGQGEGQGRTSTRPSNTSSRAWWPSMGGWPVWRGVASEAWAGQCGGVTVRQQGVARGEGGD